jgi:fermentation-respiration switch protein FrsA (DUF1100 family)
MMSQLPGARLTASIAVATVLAACGTASDPVSHPSGPASPVAPSATEAAATRSAPPMATGAAPREAFRVGIRRLSVNRGGARPLPVTVWYPISDSGSSASGYTSGRFPVVLFSHGLTAQPADYAPLLTAWAGAGFVVAAPAFPHTSRGAGRLDVFDVINQPADASYVLSQVLALDRTPGDPLSGRLDTERVAAAGHSAGGITTIGLFTVARDGRLDAGIVLAGSALGFGTAFTGRAAPQLFVHGELDEVVSYPDGKAAYDAVPWPKAMVSLPGGDHGRGIMQPGNKAFEVVADTTVEFLRWTLYRDPAAKQRLPAAATRGGLAGLDNRL